MHVSDQMLADVATIPADHTVQEAARLLANDRQGVLAVAESDHVITLPSRVVAVYGGARFAVHRPPFPLSGFTISQLWHARNDDDPGHRWLRELVASIAAA